MSEKNKPAQQKAYAYIKAQIASAKSREETSLPSIRKMARAAGVSLVPMWKAANRLRDERQLAFWQGGKLTAIAAGPKAAKADADYSEEQALLPVWIRIKQQIVKDIINNVYPHGSMLPSMKELGAVYGATYKTLAKAVRALSDEHILRPYGKHFLVSPFYRKAPKLKRIIVLVQSRGGLLRMPWGGKRFLHMLSQRCEQSGLRYELYTYEPLESAELAVRRQPEDHPAGIPDDDTVFGYCILAREKQNANYKLLHLLRHARKPVALYLEETADIGRRNLAALNHYTIYSTTISESPGIIAGQYLINNRHKRIAYISYYHDTSWSQKRLKGLRSACIDAGIPDGVVPVTSLSGHPAPAFSKELLHRWKGFLKDLSYKRSKGFKTYLKQSSTQLFDHNLIALHRAFSTYSLFEHALSLPGISAWVCANDAIGINAIAYLKEKSIAMPEKISVMGFDNLPESSANDLTSFDFNIEARAHLAFGFICRLPAYSKANLKNFSIQSRIVQRGSTKSHNR